MTNLSSPDTELIPFEFNQTSVVRTTVIDGEPWFLAMDVAEVLEYSDTYEMTKRLDMDEIQNRQIAGFGNRGVNLINEPGLYSAIFRSRKPEARAFKRWVTHDVLPVLRKTGSYSVPTETVEETERQDDVLTTAYPAGFEHPAITAQHVIQEKLKTLQMAGGLVDSIQLQARAWLLIDGMDKAPTPTGPTYKVSDFIREYFNPTPTDEGRIKALFSRELKKHYEAIYGAPPRMRGGHYQYTTEDKPLMIQVAQTIINH